MNQDTFSQHLQATQALFNSLPAHAPLGLTILSVKTESKRAEDALYLLDAASQELASSLDYPTTVGTITRLAVTMLADWCVALTVQENGDLQVAGFAHADPTKAVLAQQISRNPISLQHLQVGVSSAINATQSTIVHEIPASFLMDLAQNPEQLHLMSELAPHSYMIVPLRARAQTLGALLFVSAESGRCYTRSDLALAENLACRAALALDNARLYHKAQEAIRMREAFLAIAAHEIRSPLSVILIGAQLLQTNAELPGHFDAEDGKTIDLISRKAERLHTLIDQLLDLSSIETGQFQLHPQPLDICALVRNCIETMQLTLNAHTLTYSGSSSPLIVMADELRLEQVLHNLIQNAVKYSLRDSTVSVRVEQHAQFARVSVSDHGIGIPDALLPLLFGRFYRAENMDLAQSKGIGVGLYVAKEIIQRHNGSLQVTSQEGVGSTFTFCLPLMR